MENVSGKNRTVSIVPSYFPVEHLVADREKKQTFVLENPLFWPLSAGVIPLNTI